MIYVLCILPCASSLVYVVGKLTVHVIRVHINFIYTVSDQSKAKNGMKSPKSRAHIMKLGWTYNFFILSGSTIRIRYYSFRLLTSYHLKIPTLQFEQTYYIFLVYFSICYGEAIIMTSYY